MVQVCCICHKIINEGDRVRVLVTASYHFLKSTCTFALDKYDMEADSSTLSHLECKEDE